MARGRKEPAQQHLVGALHRIECTSSQAKTDPMNLIYVLLFNSEWERTYWNCGCAIQSPVRPRVPTIKQS